MNVDLTTAMKLRKELPGTDAVQPESGIPRGDINLPSQAHSLPHGLRRQHEATFYPTPC